MRVADVMTTDVVTVGPETRLDEAARLLRSRRISGLPVLDGGRLVGLITEGDLLRQLQRIDVPGYIDVLGGIFPLPGPGHMERQLRDVTAYRVDQLMSRDPVTVSPGADVVEAARVLRRRHIKRLPVVDADGALVGIVSRADLLRALL